MRFVTKIGATVYVVHNHYLNAPNKHGAKVIPCKIKGYENIEGKVYPILKIIGSKTEIVATAYTIFDTTDQAITAIM